MAPPGGVARGRPATGSGNGLGLGVSRSVAEGGDGGVPAGLGCLSVSFLVSLYYNTVLTWVLWYLVNSFQQLLPWGTCPLDLNRTGDAGPGHRVHIAAAPKPHVGGPVLSIPRVHLLLGLGPTDAPLFGVGGQARAQCQEGGGRLS